MNLMDDNDNCGKLEPEFARPKARTVLENEFFWNPADDYNPLGNDIGNNLFEDYCNLRPKSTNRGR